MVILCCNADFTALICGLWKTAAPGEGQALSRIFRKGSRRIRTGVRARS